MDIVESARWQNELPGAIAVTAIAEPAQGEQIVAQALAVARMNNTTSMLRTMELILGLRPMTHFDAGARPMPACFGAQADPAPYVAVRPPYPLDERNPANTALASRSASMDFTEEDRIDDDELNGILWRAIRGTDPPVPVRSYFAR